MRCIRIDAQTVAAMAADAEDILALRRLLQAGDMVTGTANWVVKRNGEYSRPDKGERIRVTMRMRIESVSLDGMLDGMRLGGSVLEADNDMVPRGIRHTLHVGVGDRIRIQKGRWTDLERRLVRRADPQGFVLVAIDRRECGVARLTGTHMQYTQDIRSGSSGKRYRTVDNTARYVRDIELAIRTLRQDQDRIMLFGPGTTKNQLANHLAHTNPDWGASTHEGIDSGGQDGIHLFVGSDTMRAAASGSRLARASFILDDIMQQAGRASDRFTMGYEQTRTASGMGAIESMVYSDGLFSHASEADIISLLNTAEGSGGALYAVDSSTDLGLQVTGLGGIASTLRYGLPISRS